MRHGGPRSHRALALHWLASAFYRAKARRPFQSMNAMFDACMHLRNPQLCQSIWASEGALRALCTSLQSHPKRLSMSPVYWIMASP